MSTIQELIGAGLAGGGLSTALFAIAAVLGKSQLAHWFNMDIEGIKAKHQKELADKQALYQRELEAYRTTLIAQAEAIKASQDVKKLMALKMAEKNYESLERISVVSSEVSLKTMAFVKLAHTYTAERYEEQFSSFHKAGIAVRTAAAQAAPFISAEEKKQVGDLALYVTLAAHAVNMAAAHKLPAEAEDEIENGLKKSQEAVDSLVMNHMANMLAMK